MRYPYILEHGEEGGCLLRFLDIPEAITSGKDSNEAIANAADCLHCILAAYVKEGQAFPKPSEGEAYASPPISFIAKLQLIEVWKESGITKVEFAKRLGIAESATRRLLDPSKVAKIEKIAAAAEVLGKKLVVEIR